MAPFKTENKIRPNPPAGDQYDLTEGRPSRRVKSFLLRYRSSNFSEIENARAGPEQARAIARRVSRDLRRIER